MFYVFMQTLLLTSNAPVKDKCNQVNIKKLLFIFNTGYTKTMAQNGLTGCHFSICVYDKELNTAIYDYSLGWPAPGKLIQKKTSLC